MKEELEKLRESAIEIPESRFDELMNNGIPKTK